MFGYHVAAFDNDFALGGAYFQHLALFVLVLTAARRQGVKPMRAFRIFPFRKSVSPCSERDRYAHIDKKERIKITRPFVPLIFLN